MGEPMILDVLLPSVLFLVALAVVFLHSRFEKKVDSVFGGTELNTWHVVLLVAAIGSVVTFLVIVPEIAMTVFFLFAYSTILFLFMYLFAPKWYLAIPIPILFIALYLSPYWNIYLFNSFAIIFAVCISVYMGSLFTWKTTVVFVVLLTILDVIQVLITKFTVISAEKALELGLPVGIILPTFPYAGMTFLGLGDVFLLGLLTIQTTRKYGKRFGLASIISITVVFLLLQTILLNTSVKSFPATVLVVSGWIAILGAKYLYGSYTTGDAKNE
jgi:presenilin-like A22 family membrane protease